ncbi:XdhC family protein [Aliikangiella sp. IMCC44359]|uniref:XdhC family protein n=1 Tax=Aliikangiella sp. IMCC44359 TaxID=3459125 RepID=UPI00403AB996
MGLLSALDEYQPEADFILAVITNTEGSTYQKTGALMLINNQLKYWGLLSGGCLESDIQAHCQTVFENRQDTTLQYDMRGEDDLVWGLGLGCNGALNIRLKFLPASNQHYGFFEILKKVETGNDYLLMIDAKNQYQLHFEALQKNQKQLNSSGRLITIPEKPGYFNGQLLIPLKAPQHILICGASPDVPPVTNIAKQLGWKTTVIDHRKEFAQAHLFPAANQVIPIKRSQWPQFNLNTFDAAVIMSHQFERDQAYLAHLINSHLPYIGLLGPSHRRDQLLKQCKTSFSQHEGRIYGPVGLDIGADSPETIALAIISEIQAVKANKNVGFCYQDSTR